MNLERDVIIRRAPRLLAIAAVAACALCFFGPWFSLTVIGTENAPQMSWQEGLLGYTWTGPPGNVQYPVDFVTVHNNYAAASNTATLFLAATVLEAVGLAFGVGAVLASFLERRQPRLLAFQPWLATGAGIASAASPVVLLVMLPVAQTADGPGMPAIAFFWGSEPIFSQLGSGTALWGAGWAWYLSVAAAVLFLVTAVLLRKSRRAAIGPHA